MRATILIVDDHDEVRASLRNWLGATFPECRLLEAKSGEDALDLAREHRPALIIMDVTLPKMNGIEATRQIKAAVPEASVVILTVHDAPEYESDAVAAGASAYILKERAHTQLVATARKLLNRWTPAGTDGR